MKANSKAREGQVAVKAEGELSTETRALLDVLARLAVDDALRDKKMEAVPELTEDPCAPEDPEGESGSHGLA